MADEYYIDKFPRIGTRSRIPGISLKRQKEAWCFEDLVGVIFVLVAIMRIVLIHVYTRKVRVNFYLSCGR